MANYFPSCASKRYVFRDGEVENRYHRIVETSSPGIVLTEVKRHLAEYYDVSALNPVARSKYSPEMLLEPCQAYDKGGVMGNVNWGMLKKAFRRVRARLRKKVRVTPLTLEEASLKFDLSKNAGLPTLEKKADVLEESMELARQIMRGEASPPPVVVFHRGKNLKVARPVQGFPFSMHLIEAQYFYPLQDYLLSNSTPYVMGARTCTLAAKVNELSYCGYVLAGDYSGYDGSLSGLLVNSAFRILKSLVASDVTDGVWDMIVSYFITSPILAPDRRVYTGRRHGVPSGSMFTQMVDSICNMMIIEYCALRAGIRIERYVVLGDDSLVGLMEKPDLGKWAEYCSELGITLNLTKSEVYQTKDKSWAHFLGHTYEYGLAARPIEETLERLLTPETLDRRIFSKTKADRYSYYIERVRAYQEDNSATEALRLLRLLETRLKLEVTGYPSHRNVMLRTLDPDRKYFTAALRVERDKWDPIRKDFRELGVSSGQWVRAMVYWL